MSEQERIAAELMLERRRARAGLLGFGSYIVPGYQLTRLHTFLAPYLERWAAGLIKRLMVLAPPQNGKSWQSSMLLPAWMFGTRENEKVILASYSDEKALDFGRDVRNICAQPEYNLLFPHIKLAQDSAASNRFDVQKWNRQSWTKTGSFYAVGKGGPITGRGATRAIVDDLIKGREDAESESQREKMWRWFTDVLMTRLAGDEAGVLILNTRWHEDDLSGRLLQRMKDGGEKWTVLSIPALALANDPLGREPGESLWPERFSVKFLQARRMENEQSFEALYQQNPTMPLGSILQRDKWQWVEDFPEEVICYIDSWDTAHKDKATSDFSARTTYAITKQGAVMVDIENEKTVYPRTKQRIINAKTQRGSYRVLIEDKASGQDLIQDLESANEKGEYSSLRGRIHPCKPGSLNKTVRAEIVSELQTTGRIKIWRGCPGAEAFVDQAAVFPFGVHDDMVDSWTQFAKWYRDEFKQPAEVVLKHKPSGRHRMEE